MNDDYLYVPASSLCLFKFCFALDCCKEIKQKQHYDAYCAQNISNSKGIRQSTTLPSDKQEIAHPKLVADNFDRYFADISKNFPESTPNISNSPFRYLESSQVVSSFVFFILLRNDFSLKSIISKPLEITYL